MSETPVERGPSGPANGHERGTQTRPDQPVALVTGAAGGLGQALAVELDQLGCRVAQGYLLNRPVPPETIDSLLQHSMAGAR